MIDATQFTIGVDASCSDGICGEVSRVVVDPVARVLTHLVVEPKHRSRRGSIRTRSCPDSCRCGISRGRTSAAAA